MGQAKNEGLLHDERVRDAVATLVEKGYAEECELHPETYVESDDADDELFAKIVKEVKADAPGRKGISDEDIDAAYSDAKDEISDGCGLCANMSDED